MDTGTHLVMGIGLYGLAHLDPSVVNHADTATAVLIGTIVGSQIPDSDGLYRFFGNSAYIKNHRGWSHSLPMLLIWPTILMICIQSLIPDSQLLNLWLWTFLAVFLHVFIDLFNTYGTQALRPISQKWVSWNILNIFDPSIFLIHLLGFVLWWLSPDYVGQIFALIYFIILLYISWRAWEHHHIRIQVKKQANLSGVYTVTPTYKLHVWNVVLKQENKVKMGKMIGKQLTWTGEMMLDQYNHPAVKASQKAESIQSFLYFTSYGYPQVFKRDFGYEVRWIDVRYHHKKHFPFFAVALIGHDYQVLNSYVGWLSKQQLEKKIQQLIVTS